LEESLRGFSLESKAYGGISGRLEHPKLRIKHLIYSLNKIRRLK